MHFVKNYYTPEKLKAKQQANAEVAAYAALKMWIEKQKILSPVENKTTSWKRRLAH